MGPAVAIAMLLVISAALTLGPAILTVGSVFGLFDPKTGGQGASVPADRDSVVRWPVPILAGQQRRRHARRDLRADHIG